MHPIGEPIRFAHGQPIRRRLLHEQFGGQWQGGISTPSDFPIILLFTGDTGEQYGYRDERLPDGTFRYTGEGQVGDMTFVRGNRAIRDHAMNGKDLYLFEKAGRGLVQYVGQMVCAGYEMVPGVPDGKGYPRTVVAFYLSPLEQELLPAAVEPPGEITSEEAPPSAAIWTMPMQQLRETALTTPVANLPSTEARRRVYQRSDAVRVYVLRRAAGVCEGCDAPAPFSTPQGTPYLEPHHIRRLSDGGPDHPDHVIALCPNCHRRVHYGADGAKFNHVLAKRLSVLATG